MKHVLVTVPAEERHREYLKEKGRDCAFFQVPAAKVTAEDVKGAEIILGNVPAPLLAEAGKLKWLQLNSAGADQYCRPGVLRPGVLLTNATGAYGLAISEYMVAQSFNLQNRLYQYVRNQMEHRWQDQGKVTSIYGSTTLVVGLGDIGGEYARRFHALGGEVIGVCRTARQKPDFVRDLCTFDRLDELLPLADAVALSLPETPQTIGLMNARRLSLMKPGAVLLNVGRGSAVVTDDLLAALRSGHLGGAALDVTDPEPLPPDHPLWREPNCIITPHISGNMALGLTCDIDVDMFCADLKRYAAGEPLRNLVDRVRGY